jgi:hypothetical protein
MAAGCGSAAARAGTLLSAPFFSMHAEGHAAEVRGRTRGDAVILSHAWLYTTVGEFCEKSSDVSAYVSTTVKPAPTRITVKFPVRAVARATAVNPA